MQESPTKSEILNKFLNKEIKSGPKERPQIREEVRKILKEKFSDYESFIFAETPVNPEMIGNILSIEFKEGLLEEDISAELRWGDGMFKYLAIINTAIPSESHKRFSRFHECAHVLHDLLDDDFLARRTPVTTQSRKFVKKDPKEILCDITASEMLFYYSHLKEDIDAFDIKNNLCEQLLAMTDKYKASPEATLRTFIENYPGKAFMFVIREGYRKDEEKIIEEAEAQKHLNNVTLPKAKPRIAYSVNNQNMDFYIPPNKSFDEKSFIHKCFYERTSGCAEVNLKTMDWYECSGNYVLAVVPDESWSVGVGIEKKD